MKRAAILFFLVACGGADRAAFEESAPDASTPSAKSDGGTDVDRATDSGTPTGDASTTAGATTDPEADGPFATAEKSGTSGGTAMHAFYPKTGGPQPVVVVAHGFQIKPSQYDSYLKKLASFGYVALTADYAASFGGGDNAMQAKQLIAGIDWAKGDGTLGPHVDATKAGMTGHSLGGKLALLAATMDPRVKAAIVLDPVDGNGTVVADLLPSLHIPTAFLGETLDEGGGASGMACAPADSNFETFFEKASSPSLQVTVSGASHMSFIDDRAACGVTCSFCKSAAPLGSGDDIPALTHAFVVAFYERHLRGNAGYGTYLDGAMAEARYVATKRAGITAK